MRATFNEIKDDIARVASGAGLTASDARLKLLVKSIQTRLGNQGKWEGMFDQLKFWVYDRVITLPMPYQSAVMFAVDDVPTTVMPNWYEFLEYGPGPQDENAWVKHAIRRGESPVVRQSTDVARVIRAYSYADERIDSVAPSIRILGYDENNVWVRTNVGGVWVDGVSLSLNGHDDPSWTESTVTFSRITQVIKPITNARVELYWADGDGTLYFAARYDHFDTHPRYEQFVCPILGTETSAHTVKAICRRKILPIITGDEELLFGNIEAYRLGLIASAKEESNDPVQSQYLWAQAKQVLKDEFTAAHGDSNAYPKIRVAGDNSITGYVPEIM